MNKRWVDQRFFVLGGHFLEEKEGLEKDKVALRSHA